MANRKLNSIKFPDIADTYILDAGKVEYHETDTFDADTVGKALQTKANIDGSYESMTVGNAEQLVSNVRVNDKTPYLFRTSGGSVDIGDREYINGIVGGTIAWNQLIEHGNYDDSSGWQKQSLVDSISVASNVLTATINGGQDDAPWKYAVFRNVAGIPFGASDHCYLCTWDINPSVSTSMRIELGGGVKKETSALTANTWSTIAFVTTKSSINQQYYAYPFSAVAGVIAPSMTIKFRNAMVFDLTQMFGSTIADYILALETANAGAGVAWFRKLFNKPYYAYNAGELKSVSGLVSHDMTGFNQWDGETESGYIWNGTLAPSTGHWRTKNYIPVVSGATYYCKVPSGDGQVNFFDADQQYVSSVGSMGGTSRLVTVPANACYMKFYQPTSTDKNTVCINLSWDGSRDGEYEPYELHSYPLDSDLTLRGIPKLDANNNLYYDGDTYEADGTVTRKYQRVTRNGTESGWTVQQSVADGCTAFKNTTGMVGIQNYNQVCNYGLYDASAWSASDSKPYTFVMGGEGNLYVQVPTSVASTVDQFKALLASRPLEVVWEKTTPTTETADPYQRVEIVSDFGTEEFVIDDDVFAIPVGTDTEYPIDLRAKLEMAPNSPSDGDGDYIVRQTNGTNEYVPLVIEDALPTIPSTAGTYTLTVTVADGVDPILSWEA